MFDFPERHADEIVLDVIRKHPIVYTKIIFMFVLFILLPPFGFLFGLFFYYPFLEHPLFTLSCSLLACIYLLYGLLFICIRWINEEFDLFILTNHRLVDITQESFLKRTITTTPLEQIQDATSVVNGLIRTLLNYGDLVVKTAAGNASNFYIDAIPDPATHARQILNAAEKIQSK